MKQVYLAHRLEPISREGDPGRWLAAPVHDPLWTLARQLQVGELTGEDAGSPVQVSLGVARAPLTEWRPASDAAWRPIDGDQDVFDAVIAGERPGAALNSRDRFDAGRRLGWLLPAAAQAALVARFPIGAPVLAADAPTVDARLRRSTPDGIAAALAIDAVPPGDEAALSAALGLEPADTAGREAVLRDFVRWCRTTFGLGPDVWVPERMERQFELRAPAAGLVLRAEQHTRPALDWFDLDARPAEDAPAVEPEPPVARVPTRIRFPGMPADRFWEFEDAQLALHAVDVMASDLARLALVEFSTLYGNDWYVLPVPAQAGTVMTLTGMVLRDCFGREFSVPPAVARDGPWAMHALAAPHGGAHPWLVVPALTAGAIAGPLTEEVAFTRDEMANLVWAVEKLVTLDDGSVLDRVAAIARQAQQASASPEDAELLYRLMTEVPEHWVPFVPVHLDARRRAVGLVEAVLPRPAALGEPAVAEPMSAVLRELRHRVLAEEEVPPAGLSVQRRWWLARSASGRRVVWAARTASAGRGEGASGLAFDLAEDPRGAR